MVYMYTKNAEITSSVLALSIEKKLSRCGIDVVYKPLTFNYREIVLESMLEQLEYQYLKLQSENNELLMRSQEFTNIDKDINDVQKLAHGDELSVLRKSIIEAINESSKELMNQLKELDNGNFHTLKD